MSWRRRARIHVLIHVSGTIRIGISRSSVVRRRRAWTAAIRGICGRLRLRPFILRTLLVRSLLILVGSLLLLVRSLLILIAALLVLKPLLILVLP